MVRRLSRHERQGEKPTRRQGAQCVLTQNVIKRMKSEVLKGCEIVFSGLIPVNQEPETYVPSLMLVRQSGQWPKILAQSATGIW